MARNVCGSRELFFVLSTYLRIYATSTPYLCPMISAFVFVSRVFDFLSDSKEAYRKENDKACFLRFRSLVNPDWA
jgi:hypothetical protein